MIGPTARTTKPRIAHNSHGISIELCTVEQGRRVQDRVVTLVAVLVSKRPVQCSGAKMMDLAVLSSDDVLRNINKKTVGKQQEAVAELFPHGYKQRDTRT